MFQDLDLFISVRQQGHAVNADARDSDDFKSLSLSCRSATCNLLAHSALGRFFVEGKLLRLSRLSYTRIECVASIITMTWWPRTLTEVLDVKLQRHDRSQQGGRSREAGVYLGFPCQRQANGTEGANRKPRPHPRRQRDSFRWDSLVDCNDAESVRGSRVLGWDVPWVEMKASFAQLPDVCGGFCGNGSSHRNKPLGTNARPSKRRGLHVQFIPLTPPAFLIPRYR